MARHSFPFEGQQYQIDDSDGSIYDSSGALVRGPVDRTQPISPVQQAGLAAINVPWQQGVRDVPVVGGVLGALGNAVGGGQPAAPPTVQTPATATQIPVNPGVSQPTPDLAAGTSYDDTVTAWAKAHGGIAQGPTWVVVGKADSRGMPTDPAEQRDHYRQYMFGDGSRLVINGSGEVNTENSADTSGRNRVLAQLGGQYGQLVGGATVDSNLSQPGDKHPFYTYTFRNQDGRITTVSVNDSGQVSNLKEASAPPGTSLVSSTQTAADGTETTTYWDRSPDGKLSPSALAPTVKKGDQSWRSPSWIDRPDGSKELWGFDPADNVYKKVPGSPTVAAGGPTSIVNQTTFDAQGRKVTTPMVYDPATRGFVPAPGLQPTTEPTGAAASPDKWIPVYRTPGDPNSGMIGFQDPGSSEFHPVSGQQPITWEDSRGARFAWDGNMSHQPVQIAPPTKSGLTQIQGAGADVPALTFTDPSGNIIQRPNPAFIPKTRADVATAVAALQQQRDQLANNLAQQFRQGIITQDQMQQQYAAAYANQIEPRLRALQVAQQQAEAEDARKQAEAERANFQQASTFGAQMGQIAQQQSRNMVGPGFGTVQNALMDAFARGKAPPQGLDYASAVTYTAPTPLQYAQYYTAQALKHISPTAAAIAGGGQQQQPAALQQPLDLARLLGGANYNPLSAPQLPQQQQQPQQPQVVINVASPAAPATTAAAAAGPVTPAVSPTPPGEAATPISQQVRDRTSPDYPGLSPLPPLDPTDLESWQQQNARNPAALTNQWGTYSGVFG